MIQMTKGRWVLAAFVGAYVPVFTIFALDRGNAEFVMYALIMLVMIALVLVVDKRARLSMFVLWGLAMWGLFHMAGGTVPISSPDGDSAAVLYGYRPADWLPRYDQAVHTFGFFISTLLCFEALRAAAKVPASIGVAFGCALMGMGLGALNEVIEFAATLALPKTGVGGYENTGWDLVSNLVGAVAGGIVIVMTRKTEPTG